LARCVGAASLDVWKDVDGFLSGDPSVVATPRILPHLHYLEAAELSYFGAKILHPRTVEPLFDEGIPIRILNITRLERGLEPYSVIDGTRHVSGEIVKSVASSDDVGILKLHGPAVGFQAGILARVTGALDANGINIKSVLTAQTAINFLLARSDLEPAQRVVSEHRGSSLINVTVDASVSIVAVVGDGVLEATDHGSAIAARALAATLAAGVRVTLAAAGASEVTAYFLVPKSEKDRAVRAVHEEFFGS
jgi:aspartate kinase/aspartokinase/homoserine dehydrogenase 1